MRPNTATAQEIGSPESILDTKGVTVAYDHPTPRGADRTAVSWSLRAVVRRGGRALSA